MSTLLNNILAYLRLMCYNTLPSVSVLAPYVGFTLSKTQSKIPTILIAVLMLINIFSGYLYIFLNFGDINAFTKTMAPCNVYTGALVCIALPALKTDAFCKLLNEILSEFRAEFSAATKEAKRELLAININILTQSLFMASVLLFYVMDALWQDPLVLPYPHWSPFDMDHPAVYAFYFTVQLGGGIIAAVILTITASFIANVLEQSCMHFENLSISLRTRLEKENAKIRATEVNKYKPDQESEMSIDEFLSQCIRRHNQLLKRIRIMNDTFSVFFFLIFLIYVACVSAAALEFVTYSSEGKGIHLIKHGSNLFGGLLLLYAPCKCGSKIVLAQDEVARAIYSEEQCTSYPVRVQTTLNIILTRAQLPNFVTAGGLATLDLTACGQAIGFVYSIFTVLLHFSK